MERWVVVPASSEQTGDRGPAESLYRSSYHRAALAWARMVVPEARIRIFSPRYGFVRPQSVIERYDVPLPRELEAIRQPYMLLRQAQKCGMSDGLVVVTGNERLLKTVRSVAPRSLSPFPPGYGGGARLRWFREQAGKWPLAATAYELRLIQDHLSVPVLPEGQLLFSFGDLAVYFPSA